MVERLDYPSSLELIEAVNKIHRVRRDNIGDIFIYTGRGVIHVSPILESFIEAKLASEHTMVFTGVNIYDHFLQISDQHPPAVSITITATDINASSIDLEAIKHMGEFEENAQQMAAISLKDVKEGMSLLAAWPHATPQERKELIAKKGQKLRVEDSYNLRNKPFFPSYIIGQRRLIRPTTYFETMNKMVRAPIRSIKAVS